MTVDWSAIVSGVVGGTIVLGVTVVGKVVGDLVHRKIRRAADYQRDKFFAMVHADLNVRIAERKMEERKRELELKGVSPDEDSVYGRFKKIHSHNDTILSAYLRREVWPYWWMRVADRWGRWKNRWSIKKYKKWSGEPPVLKLSYLTDELEDYLPYRYVRKRRRVLRVTKRLFFKAYGRGFR